MDKPVLTYSGDEVLFKKVLEPQIVSQIANDTSEWRRSYGRPIKSVRVNASFRPFDIKVLERYKKGDWSILDFPVLHIFVAECGDIETYKSCLKEEIDAWLKTLTAFGVADWMIILVETLDMKKSKNILPRLSGSVLDKIRLDFGAKNGDRCLSIINPVKHEMKATESARTMLQRIRFLMLSGYNKNIIKFEELVRSNREKRNHDNWCFIQYFLLQEQLAFVLEMLGLHSEALIQYDELDAMFSQFILNSMFGERSGWLQTFEQPFSSFHGITISKKGIGRIRRKIVDRSVGLLEFRSYLFERQCVLLNASGKPWEIAERLLPFLFGTLREIEALKIETPPGSLQCWQLSSSLEVLNLCDQVQESKEIFKCSQYSAPIWNLAKDKLYELGKLCGLLPGFTPTSDQLHTVVLLSAGIIGDDDVDDDDEPAGAAALLPDDSAAKKAHSPSRKPKQSATERLKEALGSNKAFQKLYLELSELAISTYKHVSRLRSARLVGLDLGNFYCSLNEPHKAVVFFTDLLRELKSENWHYLASQTLLELASCYRKMNDHLSYTKTCSAISCCVDLEILVRTFYFDEFLKSLKTLRPSDVEMLTAANVASLDDHFKVYDIKLLAAQNQIVQDKDITVELRIESNFPREILCEKLALCFEMTAKGQPAEQTATISSTDKMTTISLKDTPVPDDSATVVDPNSPRLPISLHLDYKQDNSLSSASVVCEMKGKQPIRRSSSTRRKISPTLRSDFTNSVARENVVIKPGLNVFELTAKARRVGNFCFKQVSVQVENLEFLSESLPSRLRGFEVVTKAASAVLSVANLVAGIEQKIKLIVSGGNFHFPSDATINLACSKNLRLRTASGGDHPAAEFRRELKVKLENFQLFEERTILLDAICDLPGRREEKHIEQKVALSCPWSRNEIEIPLHFLPALIASCRLHSSGTKKFLQVIVKSLFEHSLVLSSAAMKCGATGVILTDLNPQSQQAISITKGLTVSYLWEIQVEPLKTEKELPVFNVDFSLQYAEADRADQRRPYQCTFDVMDYTTLFRIHAKVEPSELCRVGSACHLSLKITKVHDNPFTDLMFEILSDQNNTWAIMGKSAGVISMKDKDAETIVLDVLPMSAGFLPLPNIRLSKYISANKSTKDSHPRLQPFPPGQVYNSTKSLQIHVLASTSGAE